MRTTACAKLSYEFSRGAGHQSLSLMQITAYKFGDRWVPVPPSPPLKSCATFYAGFRASSMRGQLAEPFRSRLQTGSCQLLLTMDAIRGACKYPNAISAP